MRWAFFCGLLCTGIYTKAQTIIKPVRATSFELPGADGTPVSLSSYKGKTVLIRFWVSWCLPCRIENRKLVKRYNRFRDLPFEIINISLDTDTAEWRAAINEDKMNWPQALDYPDLQRSTANKWNAAALPASFLIDPRGTVIAADAALLPVQDPRGFENLLRRLSAGNGTAGR